MIIAISKDSEVDLKVAARLIKEKIIHPAHFDKMNVGYSLALINRDVAAAIKFYIARNKVSRAYYIPHHCILKVDSARLMAVFDD